MILDKNADVLITSRNINTYKNLGYEVKGINEKINIKIEDLYIGSKVYVHVKCDKCENEKYIAYNKYIKNISKFGIYTCSTKCSSFKNKLTCIEKYGVDHQLKTKEVKDKMKDTVNKKYGVDNVFQNSEIKEQIKKSNLLNHGVEYPQQNKELLEKSNNTNLLKYGVKRPAQSNLIKNKYINTCKESLKQKFNSDKITILDIDYTNNGIIKAKCINEHEFNINLKTLYSRTTNNSDVCTICNPIEKQTSELEIQLLNFIKENYDGEILLNDRNTISPLELDIYLPELGLAFEFNGLYWHNELNKENNYHFNKSNLCDKVGIQLIHIWEDDWLYKQEIIKSMILNKLGKSSNKIYGRKCVVKEADNKTVRNFLETNHIQGFVGSAIKIGLFYENELVSLMTFGKPRKNMNSISINEGEYEMLRFCNKLNTNVIGGASKIFKYFLKTYNPKQITTYADRSHSNGNLYKQLGFDFIHITQPNYYYVIDRKRYYRFGFRKDILIKQGFDPNKSEHEIMLERKIYRIYNAGNYKFIYKLT